MPAFTPCYLAAFSLIAEENCLTSLNRSGMSSRTCCSKAEVTLGSSVPWSRLNSSHSRSSARDTSTNSSAELCKHWLTHWLALKTPAQTPVLNSTSIGQNISTVSSAELGRHYSFHCFVLETPAQTPVLNSASIGQYTDVYLRHQHKLQCWTLQGLISLLTYTWDTSTNTVLNSARTNEISQGLVNFINAIMLEAWGNS